MKGSKGLSALFFFLFLLVCPFFSAQGKDLSARDVFEILPVSIFENTQEGLTEADKTRLLHDGRTDFWELAGESDDVIVFSALPFRDSSVALRIFRHKEHNGLEAAIGTLGGPICTMELWHVDAAGRTVPVDIPEPEIDDFFKPGYKLDNEINLTVQVCLGQGGLRAEPVFWNNKGMANISVANDVSYHWNGSEFIKQVGPHKPSQGGE